MEKSIFFPAAWQCTGIHCNCSNFWLKKEYQHLTILILSWFESARLFCVFEVKNGVKRGPIICNDETEDYSYYWFFVSNAPLEDCASQCTAVNGDYVELKKLFRIFWNFSWWFSKHNLKTYGTHHVYRGNGGNYKNLFSTFKRANILVIKSYFKNLILLYFIYFSEDSESRIKAYP